MVVAHEHSWAFSGSPGRRLLDRHLIARGSDALIACSAEDRRRMIEVGGHPRAGRRARAQRDRRARADARGATSARELGIPPDAPVVGSVGALRAEKRFDVLVRAAAALVGAAAGAQVLIAGDGPERPRLEALVAALGRRAACRLLGARDDVPDVLAALDVAR